MPTAALHEDFDGTQPNPKLVWWHEPTVPSAVTLERSALVLRTDAPTDFWQKTHYGFVADNGHFLAAEIAGDFVLSTRVRFTPVHQYDQAGLMVRVSPECWLKTSVEFEPDGPARLGAVVTNAGYSDWSTQDFPGPENALSLRIARVGADFTVSFALPDPTAAAASSPGAWTQIRLAHLLGAEAGAPVRGGLYACSPKGRGFVAEFEFLRVEGGSLC